MSESNRPDAAFPHHSTRLVSAFRHGVPSQIGNLGSMDVVRAFARSAGGWLHIDGTAVSQGSLEGAKPLRVVDSVRDSVDRLSGYRDVMECLRFRDIKKGRLHLSPNESGSLESAIKDLESRVNEAYPIPDEARELADLGWYRVEIYLDLRDHAKVLGCVPSHDVPAEIRRGIDELARAFGCRVMDFDTARPSAEPEVEHDPRNYEDVVEADFVRIPDFAGYDPETRVVSFRHTDVTVTLPGGLDWTPPEAPDGALILR